MYKFMYGQYGNEIEQLLPKLEEKIDRLRVKGVREFPNIRTTKEAKVAGTINLDDVVILYLLVRTFKPKVIFEIGTWIGTSAMIMAEAVRANNNEAVIYTCDFNSYYLLDESYKDIVLPVNAYSDMALEQIPGDKKIDLVFADGELTYETIKKLKPKLNTDAIISTHDFLQPAEKGVLNVVRMQIASWFKYNLIVPGTLPGKTMIAILMTNKTKLSFSKTPDWKIYRVLSIFKLATKAIVKKVWLKLRRLTV